MINWPLILVSYFSLFVFGITDNIRGPIFPEILKDFHLTDALGSFLFSMSSLAGFLVSFGAIYFLQKYSKKRLLQLSCVLLIVCLFVISITHNYYFLLWASIFFGVSSGIMGLIPNILVPIGSSIDKRQQLISGLHSMYGIASLIAPVFVALVARYFGNWRWCFAIASIFPFLLLIYSSKLNIDSFSNVKNKVDSNKLKLIKNKKIVAPQVFLAFALSFTVITEVMLSSRIPLYMRRMENFNLQDSSLYLTYFFIAMLVGRLFFTFVKFNKHLEFQLTILGFLTIITLFLGIKVDYHFLVLTGLVVSPFYPLMASLIANKFPHDLDQAMSFVVAVDSVMLALMHVFVGKITDIFNISVALSFGLLFLFISILMVNSFNSIFKKSESVN